MAIVTTDNKHYADIAEKIREKTNTTDKIKPEEMASKIDEVYGVNPNWTDWRYFGAYGARNDMVEKLKYTDTSKGTQFEGMFYNNKTIKNIPSIDTSNGTNFKDMFYNATSLESVGQLNLSKSDGNLYRIFFQTKVKDLSDLIMPNKITDVTSLFCNCYYLESIPVLNCSEVTTMGSVFQGCGMLKGTVDLVNTGKVKIWGGCFFRSVSYPYLTGIKGLDFSSTTSVLDFKALTELVDCEITGSINITGFNLSKCTVLSKASLISFINALSSSKSDLAITFSKTAVNKAFETSEGANDGSTSSEWNALVNTKTNWVISLS